MKHRLKIRSRTNGAKPRRIDWQVENGNVREFLDNATRVANRAVRVAIATARVNAIYSIGGNGTIIKTFPNGRSVAIRVAVSGEEVVLRPRHP